MYCPSSKRQEEKRRNFVMEIKRGECFKNERVSHCSDVMLAPCTLSLDFFKLMVCPCVRAKWLQSRQTLCDPMDCSTPTPGSSVRGDSPAKNTGAGCCALRQGVFPTQGSNPRLLCLLLKDSGKRDLCETPTGRQKAGSSVSPMLALKLKFIL